MRSTATACSLLLVPRLVLGVGAEPVRVAAIGDSITRGDGRHEPRDAPPHAYGPHKSTIAGRGSWPATLQAELGHGWEVRNFGHGGCTIRNYGSHETRCVGTSSFVQAVAYQPQVVFLMLGTAEASFAVNASVAGDGEPSSALAAPVQAIVRTLLDGGAAGQPSPSVVLLTPPPVLDSQSKLSAVLHQVVAQVVSAAASLQEQQDQPADATPCNPGTVHLLNLHASRAFRSCASPPSNGSCYMDDGVHLNAAGAAVVAQAAHSILRRCGTPVRPQSQSYSLRACEQELAPLQVTSTGRTGSTMMYNMVKGMFPSSRVTKSHDFAPPPNTMVVVTIRHPLNSIISLALANSWESRDLSLRGTLTDTNLQLSLSQYPKQGKLLQQFSRRYNLSASMLQRGSVLVVPYETFNNHLDRALLRLEMFMHCQVGEQLRHKILDTLEVSTVQTHINETLGANASFFQVIDSDVRVNFSEGWHGHHVSQYGGNTSFAELLSPSQIARMMQDPTVRSIVERFYPASRNRARTRRS